MNELKPCPFCGAVLDAQWDRPNPKARCCTEGCKGRQLPVLNLDAPEDIAAWNTRAVDASAARPIGEILLDAKGHPYARLRTGYDDGGEQWKEGTPIYAAAPSPPAVQDERAAFEVWASGTGRRINKYQSGAYTSPAVTVAYEAWQARAALAQTHTSQQSNLVTCMRCGGAGEIMVLTDAGPDAHDEPVSCPVCDGAGAFEPASGQPDSETINAIIARHVLDPVAAIHTQDAVREILALCGDRAAAASAEPVAWFITHKGEIPWNEDACVFTDISAAWDYIDSFFVDGDRDDWDVMPVYAAPVAAISNIGSEK